MPLTIDEDYYLPPLAQPSVAITALDPRSDLAPRGSPMFTVSPVATNPGTGTSPGALSAADSPGSTSAGAAANLLFLDSFDHYFQGQVLPAVNAPPAPTLTQLAGGTFAQTTYNVVITYVTIAGETAGSNQSQITVNANNLFQVGSPGQDPLGYAVGYNVYATINGTGNPAALQNATPVAIGASWLEPSTGLLTTGANVPITNTGNRGGLPQKWNTVAATNNGVISIVSGRRSPQNPRSNGVTFSVANVGFAGAYKTIGPVMNAYFGFALNVAGLGGPNSFFGVGDENSAPFNNGRLQVGVNGDGTLSAALSGTAAFATSTVLPFLTANKWYYVEIEVHYTVSGPGSSVGVRVNGIQVINPATATFSWAGGSNPVSHFSQFAIQGFVQTTFDDLYVDASSFHGDVAIFPIWPNAVGTHQDWLNSRGSGANFTSYGVTFDKPGADEDQTYIDSSVPGAVETDFFEKIPQTATVVGAQWVFQVRKDEDGARFVAPFLRQGGVDYLGNVTLPVTDNYLYQLAIYNTDPTGVAWTPTTINNDEYGVQLQ